SGKCRLSAISGSERVAPNRVLLFLASSSTCMAHLWNSSLLYGTGPYSYRANSLGKPGSINRALPNEPSRGSTGRPDKLHPKLPELSRQQQAALLRSKRDPSTQP